MDERKKLINKIKKLRCDVSSLDNDYQGCEDCCAMIAEFIIKERKRITEPLNQIDDYDDLDCLNSAITKTLKLAGVSNGE